MWWTADALQKTRLAVAAWERVGAVLLWLSSWRTAVFCSAVEALASVKVRWIHRLTHSFGGRILTIVNKVAPVLN